jgi:hypothetical protein
MMNHDPNDERWEAEYWDDFAHEFGQAAYAQARYEVSRPTSTEEAPSWQSLKSRSVAGTAST